MRSTLSSLLAGRDAGAVGAFTCYDLATAAAILDSPGGEDGVILLVSEATFTTTYGKHLLNALVKVADRADRPVVVQLDHSSDLTVMRAALEAGAQAVMADGSELPLEANIELTQGAIELAGGYGADVEAELGVIGGGEDGVEDAVSNPRDHTDPSEFMEFLSRTHPSCVAVHVGNVHGFYAETPNINTALIKTLSQLTEVPLSLHGTSGLDETTVCRCISAGVRKININTELRKAWIEGVTGSIPRASRDLNILNTIAAATESTRLVVDRWLGMLGDDKRQARGR